MDKDMDVPPILEFWVFGCEMRSPLDNKKSPDLLAFRQPDRFRRTSEDAQSVQNQRHAGQAQSKNF